jgi:hypothetical protein
MTIPDAGAVRPTTVRWRVLAWIVVASFVSQSATGMLNTGGNIAGGIGAMLVPVIAGSLGWTTAVASGAIFSIVAAALWLGVRPDLALQSRAVVTPGVTPALTIS